MASLITLLASEESLIQEAALAVPHSFDKCTHSLGPLRQAVHLCLTCAVPRGLCSACSVACHGDHEQVELFPKRAFLCDCPTRIGGKDCTLHRGVIAENSGNNYGQNFEAKFCRCGREYDAKRERETMVQCLLCEDWFHESCLKLRTRPTELPLSLDPPPVDMDDSMEADSTTSNDLPPPLLPSSAYETLICGACVLSNNTLQRWAGTKGFMMVVKRDGQEVISQAEDGGIDPRWKILDGSKDEEDETTVDVNIVSETQEGKRQLGKEECDVAEEERPAKKPRIDNVSDTSVCPLPPPPALILDTSPACLVPPPNTLAQRVLHVLRAHKQRVDPNTDLDDSPGEGDIFLTEGWRDRWCRCPKCLSDLECHPYLLEEEATYEPPDDPDSGPLDASIRFLRTADGVHLAKSLEELGLRALQNVPRDRAIDGIHAYNSMRDELMTYLRPFAQEGRVVREEDVREFFDRKAQQRKDSETIE